MTDELPPQPAYLSDLELLAGYEAIAGDRRLPALQRRAAATRVAMLRTRLGLDAPMQQAAE
jgi:hypothetical protein